MPGLPRSALLAAWGNAWCAGAASLAEVVTRVQQDDEPHDVTWLAVDGLPGARRPLDPPAHLAAALEALRSDGAGTDGLRLVLPVPGHPAGPVTAPAFSAAALDAGEAVLAVRRGTPEQVVAGLVPAVRTFGPPGDQGHLVTWHVHSLPGTGPVVPASSLAEADRELRETLIDAASALRAVAAVAAGGPASRSQLDQLLGDLRSRRGEQALPSVYSPRAHDVAARAVRLLAIVRAVEDDGGAFSAHAAATRHQVLDPLVHAARRALVAACDSVLEPVRR